MDLTKLTTEFFAGYVNGLGDDEGLFEVVLAANNLDCKPLVSLCAAKIATLIDGYDHLQVRKFFGLEGDFTAVEETRIKEEIAHAKAMLAK